MCNIFAEHANLQRTFIVPVFSYNYFRIVIKILQKLAKNVQK